MIPSHDILLTPLAYLKGVGPIRGKVIQQELGLETFQDLLYYYPFRYVDRSRFYKIFEINSELPFIQIVGKLSHLEIAGTGGKKRLLGLLEDETGSIELVWFQAIKYVEKHLNLGEKYIVFGKPNRFLDRWNLVHPEMDLFSGEKPAFSPLFQAVYHTTEKIKKLGIDSGSILKLMSSLLGLKTIQIQENLPETILKNFSLISRQEALKNIHFPENALQLEKAKSRLKFDELFSVQLKVLRIRKNRKKALNGFLFPTVGELFHQFYKKDLPFELTQAQKRVVHEIRKDTLSGKQMNRLLQGDVGSGKTMVALLSILLAVDNGFQSFLMAPTEILANQHFESIQNVLKDKYFKFSLLTGSTPKAKKKIILDNLENGSLNLIIGTHALLEDKVKPNKLGLVIIDEQHRFGVEQRSRLWIKGALAPHILVMTATPIPRTLAMTLYGDLDISVLDELPLGRKPIQTSWYYENQRLRVFGILKQEIKKGRQVYIVYPLIEESAQMDYLNLLTGFEQLERSFPKPEFHISIVHGRMTAKNKDLEMKRFIHKETQLMVATTVIEVGVNVPNATVMLIESAERFGLSTLHQLRGRVGRGAEQSYCILMCGNKVSNIAKKRLETMVSTNDGFQIAEIDMTLRGAGDIEGTRQSGIMDFKLADLSKDLPLLTHIRDFLTEILDSDPALEKPENERLKNYFQKSSGGQNLLKGERVGWEQIS